jgi:hypothetical protein
VAALGGAVRKVAAKLKGLSASGASPGTPKQRSQRTAPASATKKPKATKQSKRTPASRKAPAGTTRKSGTGKSKTSKREQRKRQAERIKRNEAMGLLAYREASQKVIPKIIKNRKDIKKRRAKGKSATEAELRTETRLMRKWKKQIRKLEVAVAAKQYLSNPSTYQPRPMSPSIR